MPGDVVWPGSPHLQDVQAVVVELKVQEKVQEPELE
jgi:hypothetical protein